MAKILIIEDENDIRVNMRDTLALDDHEVYAACDGHSGVRMAIETVPDLIISDIVMPGMDGYQVLEELRQYDSTRRIPFIFLSALSERRDQRKGMVSGADDYISKPFEASELLQAVKMRLTRIKETGRRRLPDLQDDPTGLPGRAELGEALRGLPSPGTFDGGYVLVILFARELHQVFHALGGEAYWNVLKVLADRLRAISPDPSRVFRVDSGDFAVLMKIDPEPEGPTDWAQKFLTQMQVPVTCGNDKLIFSFSLGISGYPTAVHEPDLLFETAIIALRRSLETGKNAVVQYDPKESAGDIDGYRLGLQMTSALAHDEFAIHYQPQFVTKTGSLYGMEALVRWRHPQFGMVSPAQFIPIAEENGFISQLGRWVLTHACRQFSLWQKASRRDLFLSVNLSPVQLEDAGLLEGILGILTEQGIEPSKLHLELTENRADSATWQVLHELRREGVGIAIDDFGTGYSSLSRLRDMPVDIVKIDQSFIRNLEGNPANERIVRSILDISNDLGKLVVAEGVETKEHRDFLAGLGCQLAQGYLYSPPLDAQEFERRLELWNRDDC